MKKIRFARLTDIHSRNNNNSYLIELEDCVSARKLTAVQTLDDDEFNYICDTVIVPYLFEKYQDKYYIRVLRVPREYDLLVGERADV